MVGYSKHPNIKKDTSTSDPKPSEQGNTIHGSELETRPINVYINYIIKVSSSIPR